MVMETRRLAHTSYSEEDHELKGIYHLGDFWTYTNNTKPRKELPKIFKNLRRSKGFKIAFAILNNQQFHVLHDTFIEAGFEVACQYQNDSSIRLYYLTDDKRKKSLKYYADTNEHSLLSEGGLYVISTDPYCCGANWINGLNKDYGMDKVLSNLHHQVLELTLVSKKDLRKYKLTSKGVVKKYGIQPSVIPDVLKNHRILFSSCYCKDADQYTPTKEVF